jgi:hypothetical protein
MASDLPLEIGTALVLLAAIPLGIWADRNGAQPRSIKIAVYTGWAAFAAGMALFALYGGFDRNWL